MRLFEDRRDAGRMLAAELGRFSGRDDLLVLGLPRGGVPVAWEVARQLGAPLDVLLVRKLGVPGQEELAMGAIASGGVKELNEDLLARLEIPPHQVDEIIARERAELARREVAYRGDRPPLEVSGRTAILVDDGLATGSSMKAAARGLRRMGPRRLVIAVPVAPASTCDAMREVADEVVCARTPEPFYAVGLWYADFNQTTDDEVQALLAEAGRRRASGEDASPAPGP